MCVHATIRINSHTSLLCQLGGPWSNEALEAISMPNIQMFIYLLFFKENTLLWHEKRHQSTRFIFVWKLAKQYVGILFPWKWEDPIGSLSTAQSEKTTTNKKGKGREKKITWSWEPSHIMNNLPRSMKRKPLFLYWLRVYSCWNVCIPLKTSQ